MSFDNVWFWRLGARAAMILLFGCSSAAAADHIAFRGLGGASTRADVLKAFPDAVPSSMCEGEVGHFGDGDVSCAGLELQKYTINTIGFDVLFTFKPSGFLSVVSLDKSVGFKFLPAADQLSKKELDNIYTDLHVLLESRYGPSFAGSSACYNVEGERLYVRCARWVAGQSVNWSLGQDSAELELRVQHAPEDAQRYFGHVGVTFRFAPTGEASKF